MLPFDYLFFEFRFLELKNKDHRLEYIPLQNNKMYYLQNDQKVLQHLDDEFDTLFPFPFGNKVFLQYYLLYAYLLLLLHIVHGLHYVGLIILSQKNQPLTPLLM